MLQNRHVCGDRMLQLALGFSAYIPLSLCFLSPNLNQASKVLGLNRLPLPFQVHWGLGGAVLFPSSNIVLNFPLLFQLFSEFEEDCKQAATARGLSLSENVSLNQIVEDEAVGATFNSAFLQAAVKLKNHGQHFPRKQAGQLQGFVPFMIRHSERRDINLSQS